MQPPPRLMIPVAGSIIGFLVIAIATYHRRFGFAWENRSIEYPLFWSIVVLHFLVRGGAHGRSTR
jgi:uncharacterized membrane protein YphA (DoxX/SURF4 family)